MNTLTKFKSFRARRDERAAHRMMLKRELATRSEHNLGRDLIMYQNRLM